MLLDPYQTRCCGNHLSQEAYQRLQGQACPVCKEENLTAIDDKYHKRRVLSLKVRCPHKAEGCEWEGELGSLEQHLNTTSVGEGCQYVAVECPYSCNEHVQKRNLEEHKSQHCPLRPFTCQYCNHEGTHQEVTKEHWPVCEKYPLPCPNECGEEEIERQNLKRHLEQTCQLEVIKCEYSYAGCGAQLQRRLMPTHMKENTEAHLFLLAQEAPKLKDRVKQQEDQIKQQGDQIKQQVGIIEQQEKQIKQQGEQIKSLICIPPADIVMNNFSTYRLCDIVWYSPPFYSHLGGYKMCLKVYANGNDNDNGKGTHHVSVFVYLMRGEFDDKLKWPFCGDVMVKLRQIQCAHLNRTHVRVISMNQSTLVEPRQRPLAERNETGLGIDCYISHKEIYAGGFNYCDILNFCVSEVAL